MEDVSNGEVSSPQGTQLAYSAGAPRWMKPKRSRRTSSSPSVTCLSAPFAEIGVEWAILTLIFDAHGNGPAPDRDRRSQRLGLGQLSQAQWARCSACAALGEKRP